MSTIYYIVYNIYILYFVHCTVYNIQLLCLLYIFIHCIIYIYTLQYTLTFYTIQCTLYIIHCTLCTVCSFRYDESCSCVIKASSCNDEYTTHVRHHSRSPEHYTMYIVHMLSYHVQCTLYLAG